MLFSRALTNGARWYTPDVFGGPVYTPDELGAEVDAEGNAVETIDVEPYIPTDVRPVQDTAPGRRPADGLVTNADERVWQRWLEVCSEANALGVKGVPNLTLPLTYTQLVSNATAVVAQIKARKEQLAREDAERTAGALEHEAPPPDSPLTEAWQRNRALMDEMYAAGHKLHELRSTSTLEEIDARNAELVQLLTKGI
jgi:hypothetical protein